MRLIDADAVLKDLDDLKKSPWYHFDNPFVRQGMRECMEVVEEACIKDAPTVDAEPVIRCKDCKYSVDEYDDGECYCDYEKDLRYIKDWDHYCSWAEGKEK